MHVLAIGFWPALEYFGNKFITTLVTWSRGAPRLSATTLTYIWIVQENLKLAKANEMIVLLEFLEALTQWR
jgi:hypothetical protein